VTLDGEGYFEIARDEARPFIVQTRTQRVRVLGTSFNISAHEEDGEIRTTLVTGSVEVEAGDRAWHLTPGRQSRFVTATGEISFHAVDARAYSAWTCGAFVFFDDSISAICRILSRWYGVAIDASSPGLDRLRYSGVIQREETFNEIAALLSSTGEMTFSERADGTIVVTANP
jgi:ferric-dicitrate binding protein FerR (iron transport regulator)